MTETRKTGSEGERLAVEFLVSHGYRIIERNYRIRAGEIDIIARQGGDIVFIEVKARKSRAFGTPAEAVTAVKQRRISKAALAWLDRAGAHDQPARFDVVTVDWRRGSPCFELIRNAFELCYGL